MSHHFDTPTAREDPRINVCDFYLFQGRPGTTVMAMTVNPDAGLSVPDTFREEGVYAFRFDLDGDAREEVSFKLRFEAPEHARGDAHRHIQRFEVRLGRGPHARSGIDGELLIAGETGAIAETGDGVSVFAGLAPDLFAGDGAALGVFKTALFDENRFARDAFLSHTNRFERRNCSAIVVEVPSALIGQGQVQAWATASLYGHAPEVQVSRWGLPLITNIFMSDPEMREAFNRAVPADDMARFAAQIAKVVELTARLAGSVPEPGVYAEQAIARLCPVMLPYVLDTPAAFRLEAFNGRALTDDAMDVILSLASATLLEDGVVPDVTRVRDAFPYYGAPYSAVEQSGLAPDRPK